MKKVAENRRKGYSLTFLQFLPLYEKWEKSLKMDELNDKEFFLKLKQLITSGSMTIVNKNLDFVSVFIHR
jgi:hypothetical protein